MIPAEQNTERIQALRVAFAEWAAGVDARRLICIDEAGSHASMTRTHGWAPSGEEVHDFVPRNRGGPITIIGALTLDGLVATMTIDGGTDGDVFAAYVEQVLLPELRPGDLVVMDNLAAHRDKRIGPLLESVGARAVYQPPYSPDFNPIELAWAKLKDVLRTIKASTREGIDFGVALAMQTITALDAQGWFRHCGFTNQPA